MWLYRLLAIFAQFIGMLAQLLWNEPAVRHAARIVIVALSKSGASRVIGLLEHNEATTQVFTGLLNLTLYAFCIDLTLELLEDLGIPARKLLRKLYRRLMPGPQDGRSKSLPPASEEKKEEAPAQIESMAEDKTAHVEEDDDDDQAAAA